MFPLFLFKCGTLKYLSCCVFLLCSTCNALSLCLYINCSSVSCKARLGFVLQSSNPFPISSVTSQILFSISALQTLVRSNLPVEAFAIVLSQHSHLLPLCALLNQCREILSVLQDKQSLLQSSYTLHV